MTDHRGVMLKGDFTESEMAEIIDVMQRIAARRPDDKFDVIFHDLDVSSMIRE